MAMRDTNSVWYLFSLYAEVVLGVCLFIITISWSVSYIKDIGFSCEYSRILNLCYFAVFLSSSYLLWFYRKNKSIEK